MYLFHNRFPRPLTVEPMDQFDEDEGLPEKLVNKNQQYHKYVEPTHIDVLGFQYILNPLPDVMVL